MQREGARGWPLQKVQEEDGGTSLAYLPSLSMHAEMWKLEFSIVELDKQVTMTYSTKDHNNSLAFVWPIMPRSSAWRLDLGYLSIYLF